MGLQALPNASSNAGAGNLDALRNNAQFQSLLGLVQANPGILQVLSSCVEFPPFLKQFVPFPTLTSELFTCSRCFKNWGNKIPRSCS
jgi:hypothetical protein